MYNIDKIKDKLGNIINPAREDGNLADIKDSVAPLAFTGDRLKVDALVDSSVSEFERILNGRFLDTEQALSDIPTTSYASASEYLGVAPASALTSDSTWNIVRILYNANGDESKKSIKLGVIWDDRAALVW